LQPLSGNNRANDAVNAGLADAMAGTSARADGAAAAMPRFMRRTIRSLRGFTASSLVSNRMFQVSALALSILTGGAYLLVDQQAKGNSVIASLSYQAGFEASKLVVNGNKNLDMKILQEKLATQLGSSLFDFDVIEAREHVMSSPWVKQARVRKVYPDTIVVDLVERNPVALWTADGVVNIISTDGLVIAEADLKHMRLPQVVGAGANDTAAEFLSVINKYAEITSRAKAYVRVADRRWNVRIDNGPKVMLPEHGWKAALAELNDLQSKKRVFDRDIIQLDMRLPDRLVIKMSPESAKIRKTAIEDALKRDWHKI